MANVIISIIMVLDLPSVNNYNNNTTIIVIQWYNEARIVLVKILWDYIAILVN